ncbi:MAG: DUF2236 domain-containing protein [Microthrixaceae bacterium]|nr:DUF2236 domain-containing protein [Microthrixaceae bacterium]
MQDPNAATTDQAPSGTAPTEPTAPAVAPPPSEEGRDAMGGPQSARRSGDDEARASGELAEAAAVLAAHPEVHGPDSFPQRRDDGLFGPQSVAWKLFLDPSAQIGMVAAVLLQALNPNMMRLFDKVSVNSRDPEGRARRTGQYVLTTVFADTGHANAAGAAVRRMHAHARWSDPDTGEEIEADTPAWLEWTHNTIVWGVLRASDLYGPSITDAEADRFVSEMHAAAALVGLEPDSLASDRSELEAYMAEQSGWMALTLPAAQAADGIRHNDWVGNPLQTVPAWFVAHGISTMLPDWAKQIYGVREGRIGRAVWRCTMNCMLGVGRRRESVDQRLRDTISEVDSHPYVKTREEAHAELEARRGKGA